MNLVLEPNRSALGASVTGIDLADLDDGGLEQLKDALYAHSVVFVRDQQHLTDDDQMVLADRLGGIFIHPAMATFGIHEATVEVIEDTAEKPPSADGWHTDVTFAPNPPSVAILRADVIPDTGGDTMWSSQVKALAALSAPIRALLDDLTVQHSGANFIEGVRRKVGHDVADQLVRTLPNAVHPAVITHPVTGQRALYVNRGFSKSFVGLSAIESAGLLETVLQHAELPRFQTRHVWCAGDVAIWDEYATMHYALPDHFPQHRRMRRLTVEGIAPPSSLP